MVGYNVNKFRRIGYSETRGGDSSDDLAIVVTPLLSHY